MKQKLLLTFLLILALPFAAHAATMTVVTNNATPKIEQPVRIDVELDTQGDDVNTIQGQVEFPPGQFTIRNINDGSSPFSFWIQAPAETVSGTISFSGIVPDGFEGAASSVVTIWLLPIGPGVATISLDNVQLLRNDGQASPVSITASSAEISVSTSIATTTPARPVSLITPDTFTPVISSDTDLYGGKYFLAFSTTDKGSGIAYYEMLEALTGANVQNLSSDWRIATSPYLLQDQTLSSNIYVRAVDHDGNFIVVEVPAEHPISTRTSGLTVVYVLLALLVLFGLFLLFNKLLGFF